MVNNRTKKLIEVWAMKEVNNLNRLRRAGILCPEVVAHRKQLLLLSFIGNHTENSCYCSVLLVMVVVHDFGTICNIWVDFLC